jgi:phytoene synthase
MTVENDIVDMAIADPERRLALAYAPSDRRAALETLWLLDERLAGIVAATREPTIGAMRLVWWRDALIRLDRRDVQPPAEPLLTRVAALSASCGISGADLAAMEEGWSALLDAEEPDEGAIRLHGVARGARLFAIAGRSLGANADDLAIAGEAWAYADLGHRLRDRNARHFARQLAADRLKQVAARRWPAALRPLGALTLLAGRDAATEASILRRQGAPARVLRAAIYGLTGW